MELNPSSDEEYAPHADTGHPVSPAPTPAARPGKTTTERRAAITTPDPNPTSAASDTSPGDAVGDHTADPHHDPGSEDTVEIIRPGHRPRRRSRPRHDAAFGEDVRRPGNDPPWSRQNVTPSPESASRSGDGAAGSRDDALRSTENVSRSGENASGPEDEAPGVIAPIVSIRTTLREFWPQTRGVRWLFVAGVAAAVLAAVCEVGVIGLFGRITDEVLASGELSAFWGPAGAWVGIGVLAGLLSFSSAYATALAGERFLLRLRDRVFAHLQTLTPDYFENRRLGDLMARLTDDIEAIEELVGSGLVRIITTTAGAVLFSGAAFFIRWDLALVTFAMVPLFLLVSKGFTSRLRNASARERSSNGAMNSVIEESLANQSLVQAYNRQEVEAARLHEEGRKWLLANVTQARLSALYGPAAQIVETLCLLMIIGVGAWEIASGRLTIGGLLAFAAYLAYLYPTFQGLGELALNVSSAAAGADRVIEVLHATPAVTDPYDGVSEAGENGRADKGTAAAGAVSATASGRTTVQADDRASGDIVVPTPRGRGRVEFENVAFTYPDRTRPTLSGLSFTAAPGELVVCTGPSGAGKTTIAKLLLRFYDPTAGRVLLDGVDIREMPRRSLRENITILQQENLLFSATVRDNIAYGRPEADLDEIVRAAITADADGFIRTLPEGYDTPIGQRGRLLSGGQRQRLAIARAILRDAPVLILDEPMTGLDAPTAARIMELLQRLMAGRTTILITHDLRHVPTPSRNIVLEPAHPPFAVDRSHLDDDPVVLS
ncbi:ABC transporter ATP-binding protein [Microtetraspora fusca]|uniref:ABC transporter ATP-binding protein n=1 Tax=Microtetraspora fusca TaxID=1997 RepID=UPI000A59823E|nr:ABC transporter ATP-binding protein [Microtetraspora fusca]